MLSEISTSPSKFASPRIKADEQTEVILMTSSPFGFGMTKGVGDTVGLAVGEGFGLGDTVGEGEGQEQQVGEAVGDGETEGEGEGDGVAVGETEGEGDGLEGCAKTKEVRSIKKLMAAMEYIICL